MNPFGKNLDVKRRGQELSEKDIFLDIISLIDESWKRTNHVEEVLNLGISTYEEPFYLIIENLIFLHYGEWKSYIILWWLFERLDDDNNLLPIELNDIGTNTQKEFYIETPEQLWGLLLEIEGKNKE